MFNMHAGDYVTTQTHIFWKCLKTQPFWNDTHSAHCGVLGCVIPRPCLVLYPGHLEGAVHVGDEYLIKLLLTAGKKTITEKRLKTEAQSNGSLS